MPRWVEVDRRRQMTHTWEAQFNVLPRPPSDVLRWHHTEIYLTTLEILRRMKGGEAKALVEKRAKRRAARN